ncbi:hypothetical protein ASG96_00460 [Terrabacter sp. Soil810]|nr:hypothetical protein [Terrabacter sp. Soil810]KRF46561.1 hypothetical protein ASG96_00460 [Terrabacter sp. Soil810]
MSTTGTGPVLEPYAVTAPEGARPLGVAPFLVPGDVVMWRYRDHAWEPGRPETASPMRVVRDDERGLVAWLAPGTVQLTKRYADGSDLRDVPMGERFLRDAQRVQARSRWRGAGILRIAPVEVPWSVWLFWDVPDLDGAPTDPADPAAYDRWEFEAGTSTSRPSTSVAARRRSPVTTCSTSGSRPTARSTSRTPTSSRPPSSSVGARPSRPT